jgi:hypothetical protein
MLLSQSGAEATILTSLTRSWKMIANQTDRYVAIMKKEAAQKIGSALHSRFEIKTVSKIDQRRRPGCDRL